MLRRKAGRLAVIVLVAAVSGTAGAESERQYINPQSAADKSALPFSGAVLVGNTLYLAGTIGLTENSEVPDSAKEEARLVLDDLKATLDKAGMTMDDLVSVQVFCSNVAHYADFNEVYRTYFTKEFPARAFIGAGTLLFNARFEVQAIAVRK